MSKKIKITEEQLKTLMAKKNNIKEQNFTDTGAGSQEPTDVPDAIPSPEEGGDQEQPATLETIFAKLKEIQTELEPFVKSDEDETTPSPEEGSDMGGDNYGNQQDGNPTTGINESIEKIKNNFKRFL